MWYEIVGTSHVAEESEKRIKAAFKRFEPDVIAVELDSARLYALMHEAKPNYSLSLIKQVGLRGYLFALIGGWLQRKIGKRVNITPGADMLAAVKLSKGKKGLLIDRPLHITLKRLSKAMGWREFKQAVKDVWDGFFHKERVTIDLKKVPDDVLVERLLGEFRQRYPRPYKVLVEERNQYMAKALQRYHTHNPDVKILVVVGAGHAQGLEGLLGEAI
ncbi:hypothetical protein GOV07_05840 [Candidatus Woesearchaeota archaeon]|nr:hypothetical protein [Candidatus Woesearchaeota archaeon]